MTNETDTIDDDAPREGQTPDDLSADDLTAEDSRGDDDEGVEVMMPDCMVATGLRISTPPPDMPSIGKPRKPTR